MKRRQFIRFSGASLAALAAGRDLTMEHAMDSTQAEIRALLDQQAEAMRTKDIDRLMSFYAPDIVYFDTVPPLQFVGAPALRRRFLEWFDSWQSAIGMEKRDLRVVTSGDLAVASYLNRASGTLKNGRQVASWVRATTCCQRSNQRWLVTHEHVSWPVDQSGTAAKDLVP
jgi:ketosteroid isomerase-like protein